MAKKRNGLGRGIGALIPQAPNGEGRPVDVFFPAAQQGVAGLVAGAAEANAQGEDARAKAAAAQSAAATSAAQPVAAQAADVLAASLAADKSAASADKQLRQVPGATLTQLQLSDIVPNRVNPRTEFDEKALAELTHSIKEFGVFQPIVVRPIEPAPAAGEPRYELIMGERRFRASGKAGLTSIPAIIRSTQDEDMLRDALLENLHRADLNPLEEASAYQQLMQDFGITQEQLAAKIGRSRPQISNTVRLLRLPEEVQVYVANGQLSAGHARAILALDSAEEMQKVTHQVVSRELNVRATEALIAARKPKPKVKAGTRRTQLDAVAARLTEKLDTKVAIKFGAKKGQLVIDFDTVADLQRIVQQLGEDI